MGRVVTDLHLDKHVGPQVVQDLWDLGIREEVIVYLDDGGVEAHPAISRVFGPMSARPTRKAVGGHAKELTTVDLEPESGWLMSVDGELCESWLPWHFGIIYVDKINHDGILRPLKIPSKWGQTGFIDEVGAYERLLDGQKDPFAVLHPIVFDQPKTGRKVLNASSWFGQDIFEMPGEEGDALLDEVVQCAFDECAIYYHDWTMGDMVLCDNWLTQHCATGPSVDQFRLMERRTTGGDFRLGRVESGTGADSNAAEYFQV